MPPAFQKVEPNSATRVPHGARFCHVCGDVLAPIDAQLGVCQKLQCRGPYLQKKHREVVAKNREIRQSIAANVTEQEWSKLNSLAPAPDSVDKLPNAKLLKIVVPHSDLEVRPQPVERIESFRRNLCGEMEAAQKLAANPDKHHALRERFDYRLQDRSVTPLPVINGCSACRGYCCRQGRDRAFLYDEFLAWRILSEPETSPDSMVTDYLSRVPAEAVEGSCVYHGEQGCVLPREIRSGICNEFLCEGIMDGQKEFTADPQCGSVAISADGWTTRRISVLLPGQPRREINREVSNEPTDTP